jgi:hypothetical protein
MWLFIPNKELLFALKKLPLQPYILLDGKES